MAKLANVYGKALFDCALEQGGIDSFESEAKQILTAFKLDENFRKIIAHPDISEAKKFDMLKSVFGGKIADDFLGLFKLVISKRREAFLEEILDDFLSKVLEHKGILIAEVISPIKLTEQHIIKIQSELTKKFTKQILIKESVDPELIAGLKIIVGGYIIDSSFKSQLRNMKNTLMTSA